MDSEKLGFGYIFLLVGVVLFFLGKPLNVIGIILIFVGLSFPILISNFSADSESDMERDQVQLDEQVSEQSQELLEASLMLGANLHKAGTGDELAAAWIIEMSKHPKPEIRAISAKALRNIRQVHEEVESRLTEMTSDDPAPEVREAASSSIR
jgi:hypothetical protein